MSAPTKFVRAGPAPKIRRVYKEKEEEERVSKSESSADEAPNTAPEPKLRRVYYEADSFSESDDEYAVEKRLLLEERLLEERLQIKLLEMEAERAVAAAVAPEPATRSTRRSRPLSRRSKNASVATACSRRWTARSRGSRTAVPVA